MIRLVVSDLDGCLLDGQGRVPADFTQTFEDMQRHGMCFAAASGRSVQGVSAAFAPWERRMAMITDNGACGFWKGERLWTDALEKTEWAPVVEKARQIPGLICVGCGRNDIWIEHADQLDEKRAAELRKYYPTWKQADFDSFGEDLIKLALLWLDDIEKDVYPTMRALESETLCVSVTAYTWIDVFHRSVSKGSGVKALQEKLGIGKEETVVFGDYLNDLPMAEHACRSFAPMNAHPAVKAAFTQVVAGHLEGGVTRTIQALIREAENRE